jgi:hypothetical protein
MAWDEIVAALMDGRKRREWLDRQDAKVTEVARYLMGPAYEPIEKAARLGAVLSPAGDVMDARQYGSDLMRSRGGWDTAKAAGGLGTVALGAIFPPAAKIDDVLDLARSGRALYHSGTADAAEDIHKYGVEPQHGPWVQEVLAGAVDDDAQMRDVMENSPMAAWWSDVPNWVEAKVRRLTGRHDVTEDDIRKFGHLAVADTEDYASDMFRIGHEGLDNGPYSWVEDLTGERKRFYDTPLVEGQSYPFGIERDEIVTGASVEPAYSLTGDELLEFLRKHRQMGAVFGQK